MLPMWRTSTRLKGLWFDAKLNSCYFCIFACASIFFFTQHFPLSLCQHCSQYPSLAPLAWLLSESQQIYITASAPAALWLPPSLQSVSETRTLKIAHSETRQSLQTSKPNSANIKKNIQKEKATKSVLLGGLVLWCCWTIFNLTVEWIALWGRFFKIPNLANYLAKTLHKLPNFQTTFQIMPNFKLQWEERLLGTRVVGYALNIVRHSRGRLVPYKIV